MSDWGKGAVNNNIGWGQGSVNNTINWGAVYEVSESGDTDIVGLLPLTPITPFEDYYNLVVDFGDDTVSTFDQQTSFAGTDYDDWVHPSVLYFENGWNGHNYWMAITGYGATQGVNENPYLFYSDDGETWQTPVGCPAPLHTYNSDGVTDTGYLSDTWLQMDGSTMYVFNRGNFSVGGGSYWEFVTTTDGVNFSARQRIISRDLGHADYVSASFLLIDGNWYMFGTDTADTTELTVLQPTPSTSLTGTWTVTNAIASDSGALWHTEVHYSPDDSNYYVLGSTNGANGGDLMFGKFSGINAVSMETRNTFLTARGLGVGRESYYKSSFIIKDNAMELFLGTKGSGLDANTGWRVQKATSYRLSPTLDLTPYTLTESYTFADVANGFTNGIKDTNYNKMVMQFTVVNPLALDAQINRLNTTNYLSLKNIGYRLTTFNYLLGNENLEEIEYGIKTDDIVTLIKDDDIFESYINGNIVDSRDLTGTNYRGTLFGDYANNGSIKDLKIYKKPEWIFSANNFDNTLTAIYADSGSTPANYLIVDDFNRATLGTTDNLGNTYTIVGTPTIDSSTRFKSAGNFNIIGRTHTETNYTIYLKPTGTYASGKVFLNYTDNNNCRYIYFRDFSGTVLWVGTYNGGVYSEVEINILKAYSNYSRWHFNINGDVLSIYGDNVLLNTYTLPANANPKFVGLAAGYATQYVDDFIVKVGSPFPPDTTAPTAPTSLVASNITETTVDLTWTASTDNIAVDNYKVYNNGVEIASVGSATTSYTVTGLTGSTSYDLTVRALDAYFNESTDSNNQTFTTDAPDVTAPTTPTDFALVSKTDTTIDLSWTASTDAVGVTDYKIYDGGVLLATVGSAVTTYQLTGLTASTLYELTITALDAALNESSPTTPSLDITTDAPSTYTFDAGNLVPFPESGLGNNFVIQGTIVENAGTDRNGGNNAMSFSQCCNNGKIEFPIPSSAGVGKTFRVKFWVKNVTATDLRYRVENQFGTEYVATTSYFSSVNTSTWTQITFDITNDNCCNNLNVWFTYNQQGADALFWGWEVYEVI